MIIVAIALVLVLVVILSRKTGWARRLRKWISRLGSSDVAHEGTRFSDFVGFAGFGITVATIAISWVTVTLQNKKAAVDSQIRDTANHTAAVSAQIGNDGTNQGTMYAPGVDIHLEEPVRDAKLIGREVDFLWNYTNHSPELAYRIQLVKLGSAYPPGIRGSECNFTAFSSCDFYATRPHEQRSTLSFAVNGSEVPKWEGRYLWRVVPARGPLPRIQSTAGDSDVNISDWSEFGSFEIYQDLMSRMAATDPAIVLVGTTDSGNVRFSHQAANGLQAGYDMDLMHLLIEGCMTRNHEETGRSYLRFDPSDCYHAVSDYEDKPVGSSVEPAVRPNQPQLRIRPFTSVGEGLDALGRREIDVFIGSVTSSLKRESNGILFTTGYYPFDTSLYTHRFSSVKPKQGIQYDMWSADDRSIGVIENSTNHWLATALAAEAKVEHKLSVVAFPSFGAMASAFNRRTIDGVLVDNVLGCELKQADNPDAIVEVKGLEETSAWEEYHQRLGVEHETFAIAVATESTPAKGTYIEQLGQRVSIHVRKWMNVEEQSHSDVGGLYGELQAALSMANTDRLVSSLKRNNQVCPDPPAQP
jgi:ABC-type amino acid transport substrate-binding protein